MKGTVHAYSYTVLREMVLKQAWYVDLLHSIVLKYLLSACQNVLNVVKLAVALVWQVELT